MARSVETALHKLAELKFDLTRIVSAHGTAPLPPVAANDLAAIGRTNDAILYGGRVVLCVTGDDDSLASIGPAGPSSSSRDYGEPFAAIFARYNNDFYAVDPHLFSPAEVVFQNIETGRVHAFGRINPDVLARSFDWFGRPDLDNAERGRRPHEIPGGPGFRLRLARRRPPAGRRPAGRRLRGRRRSRGLGVGRAAGSELDRAGGIDLTRCRWRAGADDAAGEPGTSRLPDGRLASASRRRESRC